MKKIIRIGLIILIVFIVLSLIAVFWDIWQTRDFLGEEVESVTINVYQQGEKIKLDADSEFFGQVQQSDKTR